MIQIHNFVFNPFMENTYILWDETKEAIIVDPGCYEEAEKQQLVDYIENNDLRVVKIINTHCHIDHVFGNEFVKNTFGADIFIHPSDEETLKAVKMYAPAYGFSHFEESKNYLFFEEGDVVTFGQSKLKVLFVPGHAPGHVVLVEESQNICIGGDVLFDGSIGRTDLPGGDHDLLVDNIRSKLFSLGDETVVYPGHGGTTTIGKEKISNPFCSTKV